MTKLRQVFTLFLAFVGLSSIMVGLWAIHPGLVGVFCGVILLGVVLGVVYLLIDGDLP